MTHYLNTDIRSIRGTLYGKRGYKVRIVSESLPALVVGNEKGERYAVNITQIKKLL